MCAPAHGAGSHSSGNWFQSLSMPNTPNCVSLGRLVEELGYRFSWEKGRCFLRNPQGEWKHLLVKNFVPFLEEVSLYEGSEDEFNAIACECIAALGESHPDLPQVLDGLAAVWPAYCLLYTSDAADE